MTTKKKTNSKTGKSTLTMQLERLGETQLILQQQLVLMKQNMDLLAKYAHSHPGAPVVGTETPEADPAGWVSTTTEDANGKA